MSASHLSQASSDFTVPTAGRNARDFSLKIWRISICPNNSMLYTDFLDRLLRSARAGRALRTKSAADSLAPTVHSLYRVGLVAVGR